MHLLILLDDCLSNQTEKRGLLNCEEDWKLLYLMTCICRKTGRLRFTWMDAGTNDRLRRAIEADNIGLCLRMVASLAVWLDGGKLWHYVLIK